MKFLITGAYGFVGTNVSKYFSEKGYILSALSRKQNKSVNSYDNFFSWDDFGKINFDDFDGIIHLAGKAHDTKNQSGAKIYFDVNTELTKKIFDKFLGSKAKQFIFFSSVKAAADKVMGDKLSEDVQPQPLGPYGESKIKAEEYILGREHADKKVYILRPCMIHGPGNKGNLNLLYKVVSKGIPWPLGAFDNKRSFLSIRNLSFILEQFILNSPESGIYHLADDEALSTNELIGLIAESQNRKARIWNCNQALIKTLARIGDVLKLPLNSERLQKLTENYVVSNKKMKSALNIDKLPLTAQEGLKRTLESFRAF